MGTLTVNGRSVTVTTSGDTPLLWILRDHLNLTGTKFGCGSGLCGACTVLVNDIETRACSVTLSELSGANVVTIEGLIDAKDPLTARVTQAWIDEQATQCGYCTPGMIVSTVALLRRKPHPSDADIAAALTNLCRCGSYPRIRHAIRRAAEA